MERETQMNREYVDYTTEESWRWAIACESSSPICCREAGHRSKFAFCMPPRLYLHLYLLAFPRRGGCMCSRRKCWAVVTLNGWKYGATRAAIAHAGGFWVPYLAFCGISVG